MSTLALHSTRASLALASLLFLASFLLLGWSVFPHLPQQVALAVRERSLQKQQAEIRRLLANDPKLGQTMPAIPGDPLGRPLPEASRRRIVFVGMVSQRNLARVTQWLQKETADDSVKWIVISVSKREDLQRLQESSGGKFRVVGDGDGNCTGNGRRCSCRVCMRWTPCGV